MKLDRRALILLLIQLAIVSTIAAKYLYQRNTCPRVWTRAVAWDPELVLRGRYISAQLHIDLCGVTLPKRTVFPNQYPNGVVFFQSEQGSGPSLWAHIAAQNGHLVVAGLASRRDESIQDVQLRNNQDCSNAFLSEPVNFYLPAGAKSPFPLAKGSELWVEVTVPPKGPPRPLNLALSNNGQWQPLNF